MTISEQSQNWLAALEITDDVLALRPDYRVLVTVAEGLQPGPSDGGSDALLSAAEEQARTTLGQGPVEEQPHLAAWREAAASASSADARASAVTSSSDPAAIGGGVFAAAWTARSSPTSLTASPLNDRWPA